jgi:hypothetical protein
MYSADIYQNIPAELREMPNWVLWKKETVNGRPTKVPYQPNGWKAKSNTPATWSTFSEVLETLQASDEFSGVGLCVPLEGPEYIWGWDFDDAIDPDTGEFKEWRLDSGELAPIQPTDGAKLGSYAEITPSGAGFRVLHIAKSPVPTGKKREFGQRNPKTATFTDILFDLVRRNPGLSKEKFEEVAKKSGFRRSTIRDFIYKGILSGQLKYEHCKLSVKLKDTGSASAILRFDEEEVIEPSVLATVQ